MQHEVVLLEMSVICLLLSTGTSTTTEEIRQGMGHMSKTMTLGATEGYVGGSSREVYTARVSNKGPKRRREPTFK